MVTAASRGLKLLSIPLNARNLVLTQFPFLNLSDLLFQDSELDLARSSEGLRHFLAEFSFGHESSIDWKGLRI